MGKLIDSYLMKIDPREIKKKAKKIYEKLERQSSGFDWHDNFIQSVYLDGITKFYEKTFWEREYNILNFPILKKDRIELYPKNEYEQYSLDWIKEEVRRCREGFDDGELPGYIYFIDNYVSVKDVGGKVPFNLYGYQVNYIMFLINNNEVIIDKPRQVGFTTTTASGYLLPETLFNADQSVTIMSKTGEDAKDFLRKIKYSYEEIDDWIKGIEDFQVKRGEDNKHRREYNNGSYLKASTTTESSGRSATSGVLVFDEIAFANQGEDAYTAAMYTTARNPNTKKILISTRNGKKGKGKFYYQMLEDSKAGRNSFKLFECEWFEADNYRIFPEQFNNLYKMNTSEKGMDGFKQEILREWISTERTFIEQSLILKLEEKTIPPKITDVKPGG